MTALGILVLAVTAALVFAAGYGVIRLNRRQRMSIDERRELLVNPAERRTGRRVEDFLTVVVAAGAAGWVLFDVGGVAVPIIAFVAIAFLQIAGQRAHNSARAAAITDYRRARSEMPTDERQ